MKKRITSILAVMLLTGMLFECGEANPAQGQKQEDFSVIEVNRMQVKNEGIFYINGYTEQMIFYDFGLDEAIPVCDRPNCAHSGSDCNAYFSQGYMSGMGCYRDRLYYYDNMDPKLPFYQCEKNGSGRKVLANLNEDAAYASLSVSLPLFFSEDTALFGLTGMKFLKEPVEQEDGTVKNEEYFFLIGKINLSDGTFEIVREPEAYDNAEEYFAVLDYVDGKVLYTKNGFFKWEKRLFDTEAGKDETLFEETETMAYLGSLRKEHKLYYASGGSVYAVDVRTKEQELCIQKDVKAGREIYWSMEGDTVFGCIYEAGKGTEDGEEFLAYNVRTKEEKELDENEYIYAPSLAETTDWYVAMTTQGAVCIPKEAYEQKDWDKIQVIGSF